MLMMILLPWCERAPKHIVRDAVLLANRQRMGRVKSVVLHSLDQLNSQLRVGHAQRLDLAHHVVAVVPYHRSEVGFVRHLGAQRSQDDDFEQLRQGVRAIVSWRLRRCAVAVSSASCTQTLAGFVGPPLCLVQQTTAHDRAARRFFDGTASVCAWW